MNKLLLARPHRRYNPLRRQWLLVSPQRTQRPWQGETNEAVVAAGPGYDPKCYLCPGNTRSNGETNPAYGNVFAFDNDFPALRLEAATGGTGEAAADAATSGSRLMVAEPEAGICRVLVLPSQPQPDAGTDAGGGPGAGGDAWAEETARLGALPEINAVQIFENRGAMMGASSPHPHCQIWATEHVPDEPLAEGEAQAEYLAEHGSCLLCDYLAEEHAAGQRLVCENDSFVALVPFWAAWPFETMVLGKAHSAACQSFPPGSGAIWPIC